MLPLSLYVHVYVCVTLLTDCQGSQSIELKTDVRSIEWCERLDFETAHFCCKNL